MEIVVLLYLPIHKWGWPISLAVGVMGYDEPQPSVFSDL
jgi:hypothetical protein